MLCSKGFTMTAARPFNLKLEFLHSQLFVALHPPPHRTGPSLGQTAIVVHHEAAFTLTCPLLPKMAFQRGCKSPNSATNAPCRGLPPSRAPPTSARGRGLRSHFRRARKFLLLSNRKSRRAKAGCGITELLLLLFGD
jgi:hypothetical protein